MIDFASGANGNNRSGSFRRHVDQVALAFRTNSNISFDIIGPRHCALSKLLLANAFGATSNVTATSGKTRAKRLTVGLTSNILASSVVLFPRAITSLPLIIGCGNRRCRTALAIPRNTLLTNGGCACAIGMHGGILRIDRTAVTG